jgi:hypothetical protein
MHAFYASLCLEYEDQSFEAEARLTNIYIFSPYDEENNPEPLQTSVG